MCAWGSVWSYVLSWQRPVTQFPVLEIWAAREFQERQSNAANKHPIGSNGRRGRVSIGASGADKIVLIHTIAADSDCAHQSAILVQRNAPGKYLYPIR